MTTRRTNENQRVYTHNGVTRTVKEWSMISGIQYDTLSNRIKRNVDPNIIFNEKLPYTLHAPRKKRLGNRNAYPHSWTKCAIRCYNQGCRCEKCELVPEFFKIKCRMKYTVKELVKKYGTPKKDEEYTK